MNGREVDGDGAFAHCDKTQHTAPEYLKYELGYRCDMITME